MSAKTVPEKFRRWRAKWVVIIGVYFICGLLMVILVGVKTYNSLVSAVENLKISIFLISTPSRGRAQEYRTFVKKNHIHIAKTVEENPKNLRGLRGVVWVSPLKGGGFKMLGDIADVRREFLLSWNPFTGLWKSFAKLIGL